ncbi:MAG: uroporphyrinogen decarboxylase family protein [Verrucomicrobiia bacterium]
MPSSLTSKQRVLNTLRGLESDRVPTGPLAVHYCARFAGVSLRDYTLKPRALADSILQYYERFQPDAVWLSADTWVSAEAAGAPVAFPGEGQPLSGVGTPLVSLAADIDRIPRPDPSSQGRYPLMLEALTRVVDQLGDPVCVVACFDQYPFSLACALMGFENLVLRLKEDRPMVDALLERCAEYSTAYALALAQGGADVLSGGDSPAGLLGPKRYSELALPWEATVIKRLKSKTSVPVSLHICGDATLMLPSMATSGADFLELDHFVDLPQAARVVGPEVGLWGNLDPVGLLAQSTPGQVRQAAASLIDSMAAVGHRRFVLSSGCTLAVETPEANLDALLEAARTRAPAC